MTITAKIIADSVAPHGVRLTSVQLRYPRFIHAEVMTHRVFSRNASSSRAIPVERLIQDVLADTAMPIHWGKNQPGMQAREEHDATVRLYIGDDEDRMPEYDEFERNEAWLRGRDQMIELARAFDTAGYHKQVVNRPLEPFSHINVLVTATEWENFFELRDHEDAQPEIQVLARAIKEAMGASTPQVLERGEWHLPYITREEMAVEHISTLKYVSAARCARVSYLTHEGKKSTVAEDLALCQKLVGGRPFHASPFEHQAEPAPTRRRYRNFRGWFQFRGQIEAAA